MLAEGSVDVGRRISRCWPTDQSMLADGSVDVSEHGGLVVGAEGDDGGRLLPGFSIHLHRGLPSMQRHLEHTTDGELACNELQ